MNTGDRVRYTSKFLRSTGALAGPIPFRRGTITELLPDMGRRGSAMVKWDDGVEQGAALPNLERCR